MAAPAPKEHAQDALVEACFATLTGIDAELEVEWLSSEAAANGGHPRLSLGLGGETNVLVLRVTRTHLSYALAAGFIERARAVTLPTVLFAPYVPPGIGRHLADGGLDYVDAAGNCHVHLPATRLLAHVEGKRPARDVSARSGGRGVGNQVLFAVLAQPALLQQPIRHIATAAGLGKSSTAQHLDRLATQGFIDRKRARLRPDRHRDLLDRWLLAYEQAVRPAWLVGRYRAPATDPGAVERELAEAWRDQIWAFGGGAAAWHMTGFYRGPDTVLHVAHATRALVRAARLLPAAEGPLTLLRTPGLLPYQGTAPHLAHPLLVYTEMMVSTDPRMHEAAAQIADRFLTLPA